MMHRISLKSQMKYGKYGRHSCTSLSNAKFRLKQKLCVKNSCYLFSWKSYRSLICQQWVTQWRTAGCCLRFKRRWFPSRQGLSGQLIYVRRAVSSSGRCINADTAIRTWCLHYRLGIPHGSSLLRRQISDACATFHCQCWMGGGGESSRLTSSCNITPCRQVHTYRRFGES